MLDKALADNTDIKVKLLANHKTAYTTLGWSKYADNHFKICRHFLAQEKNKKTKIWSISYI